MIDPTLPARVHRALAHQRIEHALRELATLHALLWASKDRGMPGFYEHAILTMVIGDAAHDLARGCLLLEQDL